MDSDVRCSDGVPSICWRSVYSSCDEGFLPLSWNEGSLSCEVGTLLSPIRPVYRFCSLARSTNVLFTNIQFEGCSFNGSMEGTAAIVEVEKCSPSSPGRNRIQFYHVRFEKNILVGGAGLRVHSPSCSSLELIDFEFEDNVCDGHCGVIMSDRNQLFDVRVRRISPSYSSDSRIAVFDAPPGSQTYVEGIVVEEACPLLHVRNASLSISHTGFPASADPRCIRVHCFQCPDNGNCKAGEILPNSGYWHKAPCSRRMQRCLTPDACESDRRDQGLKEMTAGLESCHLKASFIQNYRNVQCREVGRLYPISLGKVSTGGVYLTGSRGPPLRGVRRVLRKDAFVPVREVSATIKQRHVDRSVFCCPDVPICYHHQEQSHFRCLAGTEDTRPSSADSLCEHSIRRRQRTDGGNDDHGTGPSGDLAS